MIPSANACETLGLLGCEPESDQPTPILTNESDSTKIERSYKRFHPINVALVGIVTALDWLVRSAEADEVGSYSAETRPGDDRDHLSVEVGPRRLAVEHEHDVAVRRALAHVVHAETVAVSSRNLDVAWLEGVAGQVLEALVGGSQLFHLAAD